MQSNHVVRMSVHQSIVTHAHNIPVAIVKMADGGKRFNPVYFNGKRLLEFSNLRPKDKSKVRKKSLLCSTRRVYCNRAEDMPDDSGV